VFNRWGQPVFTTTEFGRGWDGNFNGVPQGSGTYVYETEGVDYLGKTVFRKGTIALIR
jgi:gliding motility-associated-like protein